MPERKTPTKGAPRSARNTTAKRTGAPGFSAEERAAMKERARELKANQADGESDLRASLAAMGPHDRAIGERLHEIITAAAPELSPRTWYGMPAYARDGKALCYFRSAEKFKERYAMLGFNDSAKLDQGSMWPVAFALKELTATEEAKIVALVKRAVR